MSPLPGTSWYVWEMPRSQADEKLYDYKELFWCLEPPESLDDALKKATYRVHVIVWRKTDHIHAHAKLHKHLGPYHEEPLAEKAFMHKDLELIVDWADNEIWTPMLRLATSLA
jgi:hypothetical protein